MGVYAWKSILLFEQEKEIFEMKWIVFSIPFSR